VANQATAQPAWDFYKTGQACTVSGNSGGGDSFFRLHLADCGGFTANIEAEALAVEKASGSLACNCSPIISDCSPIENILNQIRVANSTQEIKITISKVEGKSSLSNDTDWVSALNGIEIDGKCFKLNLQFQFAANTIELNPSKYKETDNGYSLINEKGEVLISISIINGLEKKKFLKEYLGFVVKNLRDLIKKGEISANEIKEYREYIKTLPVAQRAAWYLELQKHVPYRSQLDNESIEAKPYQMCNVTSLAMNFEALGASNSQSGQFEDILCSEIGGTPDIYDPEEWKAVARKYDCIGITNYNINNSKSTLLPLIKAALEAGKSISLSLYPACKGHIVRIQGYSEAGLTIDDPNGRCPLACKLDRQKCKTGYNLGTRNSTSPGAGNNNFYSWAEIAQITVKYMVVFENQ
jgi:hypothetical protein